MCKANCGCGFSVRYNEFGFIEGEDAPFDNITDWDNAQAEALKRICETAEDFLFSDSDMVLKEIDAARHSDVTLGSGELKLRRDRLECCGKIFPLDELGGFAVHGAQTADFSWQGRSFEVSSPQVRCIRKYSTAIEYLKQINA